MSVNRKWRIGALPGCFGMAEFCLMSFDDPSALFLVEFRPNGTLWLWDMEPRIPVELPPDVPVEDLCSLAGILARVQEERKEAAA